MTALLVATLLTVSVSALCSTMEAMLLSTTPADIERLKSKVQSLGGRLEALRAELDDSIATILTLNTVANTLGAVIIGGLATQVFGQGWLGAISATLTLVILIFAEILPKNIGVLYRPSLLPLLTTPLYLVRQGMKPLTYVFSGLVRWLLGGRAEETDTGEDIRLLAEIGARQGDLTVSEMRVIQNALTLEQCRVRKVMTPRKMVSAVEGAKTALELLREQRTIRFGRMPVYTRHSDDITGVVRRRDVLHAVACGEGARRISELQQKAVFIPEASTLDKALSSLVRTHKQLGVVVDEYGGFAGVVTIEDIVEHLIGLDIYERDDMAAETRAHAESQKRQT